MAGLHRLLPLLAMTSLLLFVSVSAWGYTPCIIIDSEGIVHVTFNVIVNRGVNEVIAPVEPIPETISASCDGMEMPVIYSGGMLYIVSNRTCTAHVEYLALVEGTDHSLVFHVNNVTVRMVVDRNVILLTVPEKLINVTVEDGRLVMVFTGPSDIKYIVKKVETKTATQVPTTTTTRTATGGAPAITRTATTTTITPTIIPGTITTLSKTTTTSTKPTTSRKVSGTFAIPYWLPYLVIAAIAIVAVAATTYMLRLRKTRSSGGANLISLESLIDDVDKAILAKLREKGGGALQSELQKELKIPKTTLWRHVRRLERLGLIRVVREASGRNKLFLTEKAQKLRF